MIVGEVVGVDADSAEQNPHVASQVPEYEHVGQSNEAHHVVEPAHPAELKPYAAGRLASSSAQVIVGEVVGVDADGAEQNPHVASQ